MTTMKTAVKIEAKPAQVRRPMRSKVRMEAQRATMRVARKDHYRKGQKWMICCHDQRAEWMAELTQTLHAA